MFGMALLLASAPIPASAEIVLEYWGSFNSTFEHEQTVIDAFNDAYAGEIRVVQAPAMSTEELRERLFVAIAGGVAPDLVKFDRFAIPEWVYLGAFEPLDRFVERDKIDIHDVFPAAWNENLVEGHVYGIPWNMDVRGYIYNKDVYAEIGLDPDAPPRTWSELTAYSRRLDRWDGYDLRRVGMPITEGNWYFLGWLYTAGGEILDSTSRQVGWHSDPGRQAAEYMVEHARHYGGRAGIRSARGSGGTYGAMSRGDYAAIMGGSWFIGSILEVNPNVELGVAAPPRPDDFAGEPTSWSGGFSMTMMAGLPPEKQEAAWTFIQYFTDTEASIELFKAHAGGQLPARRSALINPEFLDLQPPQIVDFLAIMPYAQFRATSPVGLQLYNLYRGDLENMIIDQNIPVEQALAETARLGQMALDEFWSQQD